MHLIVIMVLSVYDYIYLNLNFKVGNYVWSSHKMYLFCYPKASFWKASVVSLVVIPLFAFFCPKVWDPICWEDIYVSFQPSFVSSVISDEPTCLAILRKIMASPIQNVTVAVAHWTKMVFYLVFAKKSLFDSFCPKVWDPISWEDVYVSFQASFVSTVISDEPTCLAILRKIMASPIQNVTIAVAHWTKMVFYWLKDISTPDFSTPSFNPGPINPGPINPRLFNHEFLNHGVEKFMVEKSGFENSGVEMSSL